MYRDEDIDLKTSVGRVASLLINSIALMDFNTLVEKLQGYEEMEPEV